MSHVTNTNILHTREQAMGIGTSARRKRASSGRTASAFLVMEEARRAGLLGGEKTEHLSFRAPKALIEAARRASGATKPTELGLLALALLAQPDPAAAFMKKTRGRLGADHGLDD